MSLFPALLCRGRFRVTLTTALAALALTFTPTDDDGTQVHYRADFEFGLLIRLVAPLVVKPKLDKLADETVVQLTDTLEKLT